MRAATPAFMRIEEATSASCDEEVAHDSAPPAKKRGFWKAALAASAALLVAGMGTGYARARTHARAELLGAATTGLAETYGMYPASGCRNWEPSEISRVVVSNKVACAALCDADPDCVAFDWQEMACEPGWFKSNGCLLLKDTCDTHPNACWELNFKIANASGDTKRVTQVFTVLTDAGEKELEAAVTNALENKGITPVTVDGAQVFMGRLLQERQLVGDGIERTWDVEWEFLSSDTVALDSAFDYATSLSTDEDIIADFKELLLQNLPENTKLATFKAATPSKVIFTTSAAPRVIVTTEAP